MNYYIFVRDMELILSIIFIPIMVILAILFLLIYIKIKNNISIISIILLNIKLLILGICFTVGYYLIIMNTFLERYIYESADFSKDGYLIIIQMIYIYIYIYIYILGLNIGIYRYLKNQNIKHPNIDNKSIIKKIIIVALLFSVAPYFYVLSIIFIFISIYYGKKISKVLLIKQPKLFILYNILTATIYWIMQFVSMFFFMSH